MVSEHKTQSINIFLGLLLAGFFYAWTGSAQAENMGPSITVVPHTFDLSVEKGEKINDRVKVYNRGDFAIPFKIRIVDFGAVEETGEMTMIDSSDSSLSSVGWFEFEKQNFIVDPGQKKELKFSINVPQDAEPQGYYAMLMIEADISTYLFNQSKIQVIPTMGVLFMLKVEGGEQANEPLTILEYSVLDEHRLEGAEKVANFLVKPFVSDSGHVNVIKSEQPTFLVKIKNNDPYHKKLSGNIKLSGMGWKLKNELEVQPVTILPGMTRKILVKGAARENEQESDQDKEEERLDKEGSFGFMQANLKIEEEQGFTEEQKQWIIVFSWKMVALLLLPIILLIILVWMWRRKRTLLRSSRTNYEGRGKKIHPVKPGKAGAKLFNRAKPKPKFKKRLPEIIGKTEEKTRGDVGIKATGEETLLSSYRKTRRKPANKKAKKSPKGGSSSGRKTTKKAVKETATKRTRKGSPRTKQQTRKTVTRKPARKKVLKGEDKKTSQRKTGRSSKTVKPRKRKTAKKKVAARKSPAKKSTRKRTRKSSPRTKQQTRKTATRKPIKKKTTPKKRAKTLKKRVKKVRSETRVSKSAASKKQKKKRIVRTKRAAKKMK